MWLLLWGLSSSKCGPLHKASVELLCCYMAGGFLPVNDPRKRSKRESRSHTIFSDLVLEVTYCHFCCIILVTQINPDTVWEKTAQRCAILRLATQEVNWEISDVYLDLKIDCFFSPLKNCCLCSSLSVFCQTLLKSFKIIQCVYGKYTCEYCFNMWISFSSIVILAVNNNKTLSFSKASQWAWSLPLSLLPPLSSLFFLFLLRRHLWQLVQGALFSWEPLSWIQVILCASSILFTTDPLKCGANRLEWPEFMEPLWIFHWDM